MHEGMEAKHYSNQKCGKDREQKLLRNNGQIYLDRNQKVHES